MPGNEEEGEGNIENPRGEPAGYPGRTDGAQRESGGGEGEGAVHAYGG
jgi:hypothetical protein